VQEYRRVRFSEVIDLSHELYEGMPNISNNPVSFGTIYTYEFTETLSHGRLSMQGRQIVVPEHCATHFDAPRHFDRDGLSAADYPIDKLVLPGHLLDFTDKGPGDAITIADCERAEQASGQRIEAGHAIIAWTGADAQWGEPGFMTERPFLPTESAQWLVDRGMSLFATDLIGMDDPAEWWWPTHAIWLRAGIPMVQQLCHLDQLAGKDFVFAALPLKLRDGTGCPVRAVALVP
jgi:kynurenine formamidase